MPSTLTRSHGTIFPFTRTPTRTLTLNPSRAQLYLDFFYNYINAKQKGIDAPIELPA